MKQEDVPQERNSTLGGVRKVVYATDNEGQYTAVASDGWSAEEIVTSQAVEELDRLSADALERAKKGLSSILEYHMYNNRMDLALISQTTGFFKWTIKRDFRVFTFNNMNDKRASAYASVLGITVDELRVIPND